MLWCLRLYYADIKPFPTRWSGCRVQVWVQDWAPACHLAISPKAVPEGNQRFRGQNQLPSSWGSSPALLWLVGQARVCYSRCWQRQATLAILTQFKCQKVLLLCEFQAVASTFIFKWKKFSMELTRSLCWPKQHTLCFAQPFYQSLVRQLWSLSRKMT